MDNMVLMAAWNNIPDPGLMPKDRPKPAVEAAATVARGFDRPDLLPEQKKTGLTPFRR